MLLSLASDIEGIILRIPQIYPEPPHPDPPPGYKSESQRSLEWLESKAQIFRRLATLRDFEDFDFIPVIVSRQGGGRGKRARSREIGVFMKLMVNFMYRFCGKPRYEYVAMLTSVAFQ